MGLLNVKMTHALRSALEEETMQQDVNTAQQNLS